jgi:hypothetical protein
MKDAAKPKRRTLRRRRRKVDAFADSMAPTGQECTACDAFGRDAEGNTCAACGGIGVIRKDGAGRG